MAIFQPKEIILNGTYRIEKQIGEGKFGEVYLATYLELGIQRAIKVVKQGEGLGTKEYKEYWERFKLEAQLGAKFHQTNIIHVNQFCEENGNLILVMDYAPNGSLANLIENAKNESKRIPIDQSVKWIEESLEGLQQLHDQGFVHRDIKPSNILLDTENHACIGDLGVVQFSTETRGDFSGGIDHPGTPKYMPIEQTPGHYLPLRPSADVYAMGCVLFELITKKPYYDNEGKRVKSLRLETPLWLDRVVAKAVNPDSKKRYANAKEMQNALERQGRRYWILFSVIAIIGISIIGISKLNSDITRLFDANVITPIAISGITDTPISSDNLQNSKNVGSGIMATEKQNPSQTQAQITSLTIGSTNISSFDGMKMDYVPAGEFLMGSTDEVVPADEQPQHSVYLDAYWIDQTEVTNSMFSKFVDDTGYKTQAENVGYSYYYKNDSSVRVVGAYWTHPNGLSTNINNREDYPVVNVSWEDAVAYCKWAGRRLPTEAEWEKAARGTDGRIYPWGNQLSCSRGNFDDETTIDASTVLGQPNCDGFDRTSPVGSFPEGKSPYGAMDMSGNVWEWVNDWYLKNYYAEDHSNNPQGPSSSEVGRVLRGGSWYTEEKFLRSAFREADHPLYTNDSIGFRCAVGVTQ